MRPDVPAMDASTLEADWLVPETRPSAAVLVDVREESEWFHGHIPGTTNVPLGRLHLAVDDLPRDARIVCICRSGNRSATATSLLIGVGFDAINLTGGTQGWATSGRAIVDRNGRPGVVA